MNVKDLSNEHRVTLEKQTLRPYHLSSETGFLFNFCLWVKCQSGVLGVLPQWHKTEKTVWRVIVLFIIFPYAKHTINAQLLFLR